MFGKEDMSFPDDISEKQTLQSCTFLQVNDISFHPVHGTLSTVGSDGRFSFWDKDARIKLKTSEQFDQPLTACNFNPQGNIFAYATSYDWSKVCYVICLLLGVLRIYNQIESPALQALGIFQALNIQANKKSVLKDFVELKNEMDENHIIVNYRICVL